MTTGIYRITCRCTRRSYVGSGVNVEARWRTHLHRLRKGDHHSIALQRAWEKHGETAFSFVLIEVVEDKTRLIEREQFWLDKIKGYNGGYNCSPIAGSQLGHRWTQEQRAKLKNRPRRVVSEEEKARLRSLKLGKPRSAEARAAVSAGLKKWWKSDPTLRERCRRKPRRLVPKASS